MHYDIVNLKEMTIVGLSTITSNEDPEMSQKIAQIWSNFCYDGVYGTVNNKANAYTIGLYSDYMNESYTVTVGCEVTKVENPDLVVKSIPAGRYAKFSIRGNMQTAVGEAWEQIWKMDLDRSYTGDFEEYLSTNWDDADINIYIALK